MRIVSSINTQQILMHIQRLPAQNVTGKKTKCDQSERRTIKGEVPLTNTPSLRYSYQVITGISRYTPSHFTRFRYNAI
jgi:hypothetical protein